MIEILDLVQVHLLVVHPLEVHEVVDDEVVEEVGKKEKKSDSSILIQFVMESQIFFVLFFLDKRISFLNMDNIEVYFCFLCLMYSFSQIQVFQSCPRKYQFQYLESLKRPKS